MTKETGGDDESKRDGSGGAPPSVSSDDAKEHALLHELDRALASGRAQPGVFERLTAKTR
ncbi:MAG: hypothetical protein IPG17_32195 [Sandaracinaceae bacterium]|nr:hypothetical protein [Sandaracinaceae bacterium]MBK7154341.1 hypothetical protein [Sandaracinaceae bacterium]MBK7775107.1 hypothetical protein [Sandaracinaceae bacterium]MBK8411810.1 hypothetical protein [Sandaracinaceae bacterium]